MKDLEKENCDCCTKCNCGDDCECTPDNKCCDECTCDNKCGDECTCGNECNRGEECSCDTDCECHSADCDDKCDGVKDNQHTKQDKDCNSSAEDGCCKKCDCNDSVQDEKCACGCGEDLDTDATADAYFKQILSLRAEFDNYRKRTQNDIANAYSNGFNQAITEFLPALDSFKMATEYITDTNTLMGIQYIEKGILSTLEKMGVTVIDATGQFNPEIHQAIGSEVSCEHKSGEIIKECFKGFKLGDKIIRYSQVIVAK